MCYNLKVRNAHEAVLKCVDLIKRKGVEFNSRNGKVRRLTKPLCIEYQKPIERFEFWQEYRDSNPFFLIFEALWMLNGNNNVSFVDYFAPMALYSDDGETLNGAYGHRWINHFKFDQIDAVIKILREDKESRRAVIYMGSGDDLKEYSKDYCCNMCISFDVQNNSLNMTVYNRSNDLIYGAPSANAVHFSYLLQYIAIKTKLKVGKYYQITNNGHIYVDEERQKRSLKIYNKLLELCSFKKLGVFLFLERITKLRINSYLFNVYKFLNKIRSSENINLLERSDWDFASKDFDEDLKEFFTKDIKYYIENLEELKLKTFKSGYFNWIAKPLLIAFIMHKEHKDIVCKNYVYECKQEDIRIACAQWLSRRY